MLSGFFACAFFIYFVPVFFDNNLCKLLHFILNFGENTETFQIVESLKLKPSKMTKKNEHDNKHTKNVRKTVNKI